jgi:hypothetical protein
MWKSVGHRKLQCPGTANRFPWTIGPTNVGGQSTDKSRTVESTPRDLNVQQLGMNFNDIHHAFSASPAHILGQLLNCFQAAVLACFPQGVGVLYISLLGHYSPRSNISGFPLSGT